MGHWALGIVILLLPLRPSAPPPLRPHAIFVYPLAKVDKQSQTEF
jgi:hypothetical protein